MRAMKEIKNNPYNIYTSSISRRPWVPNNIKRRKKAVLPRRKFSPRFIYSMCKKLDGLKDVEGTTAWWSMRVLKGYGACEEKFYSDNATLNYSGHIHPRIGQEILDNAYHYRDPVYQRLFSLNDIKKLLKLDESLVALSFDVFKGVYDAPKGHVPLPNPSEKRLGGHCVAVVGWNDEKQVVKFANSWGEEWGDKGYGYLPYSYLDKYVIECWAPMHRKVWQECRQKLGESSFKDGKGRMIKMQLHKVPPVVYGRSSLWVLDIFGPNGKIGGWSHFSMVDYGNLMEIAEIFILPQYRNQGWGTKILECIEDIARRSEISEIAGWVSVQDLVTKGRESMVRDYFTKAGFSITPDITKFRGSYWKIRKTTGKDVYF